MNNAQRINQDSGNCEWYTPQFIIDAARQTMGGIDLDPASSLQANQRVQAAQYFTAAQGGLMRPWHGRVWMNHPFSREGNPLWVNKLIAEHDSGRVTEACCITFAATSERWFQPLLDFLQCFLSPRTNYYLPNGEKKTGVTKGSVVTYLGPNTGAFAAAFEPYGRIK